MLSLQLLDKFLHRKLRSLNIALPFHRRKIPGRQLFQMRQALGVTQDWPVVVVGAGNLGRALANYGGSGI